MKNFLSSLLATIIGILIMTILVVLIFVGIIAASTSKEAPEVKENSLMVAKFNSPIADRADDNPFSKFLSGNFAYTDMMGLDQILKDIKKAKTDDNIKGIFMSLSNVPSGIATIGEVRDALIDFKESGKFIYAYADVFSQKSYYLATVADSIFMTPEGMFLFTGLSAEVTFYKNALEKLGVDMQVIKHGSYKSAAESLTRENLSAENREQIEGYVGSIWDKMISDISESRNISVEKLNQYADELISIENEKLVETGMIDGMIYFDEMLSLLKEKMDVEEKDDLESIKLTSYKDVPLKEKKEFSRDKIAVIYAMGMVVDGNAGEGNIGSERIAKAIRKARRDKTVKAIVLRVNSGGGSVVASDVIYREVKLAAEEKPFVASMGDVAASGGYYIVAPADTILASPNTITGSIGVIFTIPNMKELMNDKLGITTDVVRTNRHAGMLTIFDPLDSEARMFFQKSVDDTYKTFVEIVSEGRNKSYDEIDAISGGRVWSGKDALDLGLIDMFGGLEKSIEVAAEMAGLETYRVQSLPKLEDPLTMIMKELSGGAQSRAIKNELGDQYRHYKTLQQIKEMRGLQAIMPCEIDLH
ncbi:MAG: signal peptide peptidase SppA [Bacteroidales bacterium]|nr:signal peptide peptidase SppA [Bacteroidales bacterium]